MTPEKQINETFVYALRWNSEDVKTFLTCWGKEHETELLFIYEWLEGKILGLETTPRYRWLRKRQRLLIGLEGLSPTRALAQAYKEQKQNEAKGRWNNE